MSCPKIIKLLTVSTLLDLNWCSLWLKYHTHTHTRLMALCLGLPRWAGTRKVKPIWILLKQETVSGSGISWAICKSANRFRQITMPAPHRSVFYRPNAFLPPNQQRRSNESNSTLYKSTTLQKYQTDQVNKVLCSSMHKTRQDIYVCSNMLPSVLWRCCLGGRKGIWPVKNWEMGCWHGYLSGARCRLAYGPADATATHCLLLQ